MMKKTFARSVLAAAIATASMGAMADLAVVKHTSNTGDILVGSVQFDVAVQNALNANVQGIAVLDTTTLEAGGQQFTVDYVSSRSEGDEITTYLLTALAEGKTLRLGVLNAGVVQQIDLTYDGNDIQVAPSSDNTINVNGYNDAEGRGYNVVFDTDVTKSGSATTTVAGIMSSLAITLENGQLSGNPSYGPNLNINVDMDDWANQVARTLVYGLDAGGNWDQGTTALGIQSVVSENTSIRTDGDVVNSVQRLDDRGNEVAVNRLHHSDIGKNAQVDANAAGVIGSFTRENTGRQSGGLGVEQHLNDHGNTRVRNVVAQSDIGKNLGMVTDGKGSLAVIDSTEDLTGAYDTHGKKFVQGVDKFGTVKVTSVLRGSEIGGGVDKTTSGLAAAAILNVETNNPSLSVTESAQYSAGYGNVTVTDTNRNLEIGGAYKSSTSAGVALNSAEYKFTSPAPLSGSLKIVQDANSKAAEVRSTSTHFNIDAGNTTLTNSGFGANNAAILLAQNNAAGLAGSSISQKAKSITDLTVHTGVYGSSLKSLNNSVQAIGAANSLVSSPITP